MTARLLNTILLVCLLVACVLGLLALCTPRLDPGTHAPQSELVTPEEQKTLDAFYRKAPK